LLFGLLGHVPSDGEQAESEGVRLTAERVNGRRIVTVTAEKMAVAEQDPSETESPEAAE
jgi:CBS domain containing-hemolysin-like protein